jgi:ankyrin repeat protein
MSTVVGPNLQSVRSYSSTSEQPILTAVKAAKGSQANLEKLLPDIETTILSGKLSAHDIVSIFKVFVANKVPMRAFSVLQQGYFLFASLQLGNDELLNYCLNGGVSIHLRDHINRTVLHVVAELDLPEMLPILLKFKPDLDAQIQDEESPSFKMTPLHTAVDDGNFEVVDILVKAGADLEITDACGVTPFLLSVNCDERIFQLLLSHETNLLQVDSTGRTAMHRADRVGTLESLVGRAKQLNTLQACLEAENNDGETPIFELAKGSNLFSQNGPHKVDFLLTQGVQVDAIDKDFRTALHWASLKGRLDILVVLIKHQATLDLGDGPLNTPLHLSVYGASASCAKALLKAGADQEMSNMSGTRPLRMTRLLLEEMKSQKQSDGVTLRNFHNLNSILQDLLSKGEVEDEVTEAPVKVQGFRIRSLSDSASEASSSESSPKMVKYLSPVLGVWIQV